MHTFIKNNLKRVTSLMVIAFAYIHFIGCNKPKAAKSVKDTTINKVTIQGKINFDYSDEFLYLEDYTSWYMNLTPKEHKIAFNDQNEFTFTFELKNPTYFRLYRNFLYLSPGDSLYIELSDGRINTKFSGKGKEANEYLNLLPYPKGGSFIGELSKDSIPFISKEKFTKMLDSITNERKTALLALNNTSKAFKTLEETRLNFEYVNSLVDSSTRPFNWVSDPSKIDSDFLPIITSTLKSTNYNNEDNLQFEVFQKILNLLYKDHGSFITDHQLTPLRSELKDYCIVNKLSETLSDFGYSKIFHDQYSLEKENIQNGKYTAILEKMVHKYKAIIPGNPAPEIIFNKTDGKQVKLSEFKGKIVVIDVWATWCKPCMQEKPIYEELAKKYLQNKNIIFLSLSIDSERVWKKQSHLKTESNYMNVQVNQSNLSDYFVETIPRFFVIDQSQNIIDVYAPLPSSGKLEEIFKPLI